MRFRFGDLAAHRGIGSNGGCADQLRSQMARCSEVLTLNPEERARIVKVYRDIEAALSSIDELLAFQRSEER
jgi:hypothetical protein